MSNQFYEFISSELLSYLDNNNITPGDRYFLILNDYNEISKVKNAIENNSNYRKQTFEAPEYNFSTINFILEHSDVIFVFISEGITHDFLVTLRNKVSNQDDIWKNKSVVFIINEDLDSITGGSFDLSKQGAPFHQTTLRDKIKTLIEDTSKVNSLGNVEKEVLSYILDTKFVDEFVRYTLMDFEGIYSIYQKQSITDDDYKNLELFKDKQLGSFSHKNDIRKRLEKNKELYNDVQLYHTQGDVKQKLQNDYENTNIISQLSSEKWQDTEFNSVLRSYDEMQRQKKVSISFDKTNFMNQFKNTTYEILEKPNGQSKAALRTRNIIINRNNQKLSQIIFPFDTKINKVNIRTSKSHDIEKSAGQQLDTLGKDKNIIVNIPDIHEDTNYLEITYRHENKTSLRFTFRVLIVNFSLDFLENYKSKFLLNYNKTDKLPIVKIKDFDSLITFGSDSVEEIVSDNIGESYNLGHGALSVNVKKLINEDSSDIYFYLKVKNSTLRVELETPKNSPIPRSSQYLYKKIYKNAQSMSWDGNILIQDTDEYYVFDYFKEYLKLEEQMIDNKTLSASFKNETLTEIPLELEPELLEAYNNFFEALKVNNTLPSITAFNNDILLAAENICNLVDAKISSFKIETRLDKITKNISEIGKLYFEDEIIFTIINPFMLRYEIEKYKFLKSQNTSEKIIKKFNPSNLIPFYIENENKFFSEYDDRYSKSLIFKNYNKHNNVQGENIENIIKSRLTDFQKHFSYLFSSNKKLPIKLKFSNISEYKHILKGVILYILNQSQLPNKSEENIPSIHLYIEEQSDLESYINIFNIDTLDDLKEILNLKIPSKLSAKYDEIDILKIINSKINIFVNSEQESYHITFFNFNEPPTFAVYSSKSLNCSFANNGYISSNSIHTKMYENYVTGFGIKGFENTSSNIVNSAKLWNSLFVTNKDNNLHPFKPDSTLVNNISDIESQEFDGLFNSSYWVTFIDPAVDLSYFNDSKNPLYIIHYSDQTSSLNYESITVTNKLKEYEYILSEYLRKVHPEYKPANINNIIRSFNILNGEWLLRIIGHKKSQDNSVREKLSIISAYKNVMSLLDNNRIVWIPISLEEILRVSRLQGINQTSDLFSAKELGYKGVTSDDLLFIGVEVTDSATKVHLLPAEVKIGLNSRQVSNKAQTQLSTTFKIIKEQLIGDTDNIATQKFYRFFFLNLYFSNLEKFIKNGLVSETKYMNLLEEKARILNSDNRFTTEMNDYYYSGISVLFTTNNYIRKINRRTNESILELQLNEHDGYIDAEKDYQEILNEWNNDIRGLDQSHFLKTYLVLQKESNTNVSNTNVAESHPINDDIYVVTKRTTSDKEFITSIDENFPTSLVDEHEEDINIINDDEASADLDDKYEEDNNIVNDNDASTDLDDECAKDNNAKTKIDNHSIPSSTENSKSNLVSHNIRLLLGKVKGSNTDMYWEYGHKKLSNRHLLITGKSGQGKTYFMQTLLYEMSKNNLDSFVIDYTDSFLGSQLEDSLKEKLDDKIISRFIIQEKLPVNPFKKNTIELDKGFYLPETNQDIAERVVQILDFVFKLGVQQNYKLKEVILECLAIYNENLTFTIIKNRLQDDEEHTLLGRLTSLLDRDPFDYNSSDSDWSNYFSGNGNINIFQLKGYPNTIQQIITEFLLWDIYNYSTRNGHKNIAIPVLLDEMQNLNHKNNSPTGKIMREGRKFGWSTWLATQSLSSLQSGGHDLSHIYNAATQIHFAAPENQIRTISNLLSNDKDVRQEWETKLSTLQKGECVVSGYSNINNELVRTTEIVKITSLDDRN